MKIIFLDKDGVVNSDQYFDSISGKNVSELEYDVDPKTIDLLEEIVKETGAKIVVTASARYTKGAKPFIDELIKRNMYLDKTPLMHNIRGLEIKKWLVDHPGVEDFVILDDEIFESYDDKLLKKLVKTDGNGISFGKGLTSKEKDEVISRLGKTKEKDGEERGE